MAARFPTVIRPAWRLPVTRDRVEQEHWDSPAFLRVNHLSSAARASAFGVLVPTLPHAGSVGALAAAAWFTGWYPAQRRRMPPHG